MLSIPPCSVFSPCSMPPPPPRAQLVALLDSLAAMGSGPLLAPFRSGSSSSHHYPSFLHPPGPQNQCRSPLHGGGPCWPGGQALLLPTGEEELIRPIKIWGLAQPSPRTCPRPWLRRDVLPPWETPSSAASPSALSEASPAPCPAARLPAPRHLLAAACAARPARPLPGQQLPQAPGSLRLSSKPSGPRLALGWPPAAARIEPPSSSWESSHGHI